MRTRDTHTRTSLHTLGLHSGLFPLLRSLPLGLLGPPGLPVLVHPRP